jgi:hypothetical protein
MFEVIKPPYRKLSIFLAGSIEMGLAEDWQSKIEKELDGLDVTIYNPRRDSWDSSWVQSIHNEQFREQVEWELDHLDKSDVIVMYFDENTKSPISLLELGLYASSGKMIVYCPEGFWRKGNVDIVAQRYDIRQVNSFNELLVALKSVASKYYKR